MLSSDCRSIGVRVLALILIIPNKLQPGVHFGLKEATRAGDWSVAGGVHSPSQTHASSACQEHEVADLVGFDRYA